MNGNLRKILVGSALFCGCTAQSYFSLSDQHIRENLRNIMLGHAECPPPTSLIVEDGSTKVGVMLYSECSTTEMNIIALSPFGLPRGEIRVDNNGRVDFNLHRSLETISPFDIIKATLKKTD